MVGPNFILTDDEGTYKVVRVLGWTDAGRCYCNCSTPIAEWPFSGWQLFAFVYVKDGEHRCTTWRGLDTDPTIYELAGYRFVGTQMADDDYDALCLEAREYLAALTKKLDASTPA